MILLLEVLFLVVLLNVVLLNVAALCAAGRSSRRPDGRPDPASPITQTAIPASVCELDAELAAEDREAELARQLLAGTLDPADYRREMDELAHESDHVSEQP